ncbi:tripartite tricarboxylate transporter TctB family protein [Alphaproteobacteria bacterium KMM 3653]|uniref:Tripartite tricarboxylate transporter TctB family protein n=1 Tax=Harenicola maris TaxID=2841044 RepID=A0AAP2CX73_9RHOB|nr:tripartite tricarboxylate transporter TctB family protein [Harenicola maris]
MALGMAMSIGGWQMDRLEIRKIHPASIPGLVPIVLGGLLIICAVLLLRSTFKSDEDGDALIMSGGSWARLAITGALCIFYALGLVGWLSYFWATAVFTFAFCMIFSFPVDGDLRQKGIATLGALALGVGIALGSSYLFQELFLVRLP